jgi:hypothetical protein
LESHVTEQLDVDKIEDGVVLQCADRGGHGRPVQPIVVHPKVVQLAAADRPAGGPAAHTSVAV